MPIPGLIILIVSLLALVAGIIFMLSKSYFPPFKHYKEGAFNNVKARVWAENADILDTIDAKSVAKAAWCVQAAWNDLGMKDVSKVRETLVEVAMIATTNASFQKYAYFNYLTIASCMVWTKDKFWNKKIPMCVIHENTLLMRDAESVYSIHEFIHAAAQKVNGSADNEHANDELWQALTKRAVEFYGRY